MSARLEGLGRWAARHRQRVVAGWAVLLLLTVVGAATMGGAVRDAFPLPGTESQAGNDLLSARFESMAGSTAEVVLAGDVTARQHNAVVELRRALADIPGVAVVSDPYAPGPDGSPAGVAPSGAVAHLSVRFPVVAPEVDRGTWDHVTATAEVAATPDLQVEVGGEVAAVLGHEPPGVTSELIGVAVAVVVLLLTFGSLLAAGLPLVAALPGVLVSLGTVLIVARFADVTSVAEVLGRMIGLAVGIDYALFLLSRFRDEIRTTPDVETAVGRTTASAGSAVVFAGTAVVVAMSGLLLVGIPFLAVMGVSVALSVLVAMAIALTLVPALLAWAGPRLAHPTLPLLRNRAVTEPTRTHGARWATAVAAHPWRGLVGALLVLGVLSLPLVNLQTALPSNGTAATDSSRRQAADLLADGFGAGANSGLVVVVDTAGLADPDQGAALNATSDAVARFPGVQQVNPPQLNDAGDAAVLSVVPSTGPIDETTLALVDDLRDGPLARIETTTGATTYVAGPTALSVDIDAALLGRFPLLVGAVVAVTFLLLMVAFRSILIPLKAGIGILLSISAALGVVVVVFQQGVGASLIGVDGTQPVVSFLPVLAFAMLFGMSMDYEVFILSRVQERWLATGDATRSVVEGVGLTARVITAAATIMIFVFGAFVFGDDPTIKMVGLGLATAVLIDATVVRLVLVPATMVLFGRYNWWLPAWLERILPYIDIEGEHPARDERTVEPAAAGTRWCVMCGDSGPQRDGPGKHRSAGGNGGPRTWLPWPAL